MEDKLMELIDKLIRTCEDGIASQRLLIDEFVAYREFVYENLLYEVSPN